MKRESRFNNYVSKTIKICLMFLLAFCFTMVLELGDVYAVSNTGNERDDIVAQALSQNGVQENRSAEFYTPYHRWFWDFMGISGNDRYGWRSLPSMCRTGAWCYMFVGWAADTAGCKMTVYADQRGVYIDGRNARAFDQSPDWFGSNGRKISISTTNDVINKSEKGDFVFCKSGTGGYNHVFIIASNSGGTVKSIEGNVGASPPKYVSSRTMTADGQSTWNKLTFLALCKPMYRATATFYTRGGSISSVSSELSSQGEGGSGDSKYYQYKFYDDIGAYNGVTISLPSASKSGDPFLGWYTNSSFSGSPVTQIPSRQRGNITYYAKWQSDDAYKVTLHPNGGTIAMGRDVTEYKKGVGAILPSERYITRSYYNFTGWYSNRDCNGSPVSSIPATATGDKEYWAGWTPKVYSVTLHPNGGTISPGANVTQYTYTYGAPLPTASQITKSECEFAGWYDNPSFTGSPVNAISSSDHGDKEYWARWITFDVQIVNNPVTIYGVRGDRTIFKTEDLKWRVDTESTARICAYFTQGANPSSAKYAGSDVSVVKGREVVMKLPDSVLRRIKSVGRVEIIYLQIVTSTNVKITRPIRVRLVLSMEER